jgi:kynureninase
MISRPGCALLDAADPLAAVRGRFLLPDGLIYLDGNSLGALPAHVPERIRDVVETQWGSDLIGSWNRHWADLPHRVGDRIATLIGAEPGSVVAADSTSINVYKAVDAARRLRPDREVILTDSSNFPTDVYVMRGIADATGAALRIVEPDAVHDAIDGTVAVVALTEVDYRTGRRHRMAEITNRAHDLGAVTVWDLAHSVGAFPVTLSDAGADLAVGCGYKYLNGGPGAPAFLYIAPRHQASFHNPITGWFGHSAPFEFSLEFTPAEGIARARVGTPHILSLVALDAALDVFDDVDMEAVRAKSVALTDLFMDLADERLGGFGFEVATPRSPDDRGSQVSLRHEHAFQIVKALIARNVVGDFRTPDIARFGFAPLYLRYVDAWDAVDVLVDVMHTDAWRDPRFAHRSTVT